LPLPPPVSSALVFYSETHTGPSLMSDCPPRRPFCSFPNHRNRHIVTSTAHVSLLIPNCLSVVLSHSRHTQHPSIICSHDILPTFVRYLVVKSDSSRCILCRSLTFRNRHPPFRRRLYQLSDVHSLCNDRYRRQIIDTTLLYGPTY